LATTAPLMRANPEQKFLPWVQALRAFAALAVAFYHIAHDDITNGGDPAGWFAAITRYFPWDAGVDIFFVISGFVIVHASTNLFAQPGGTRIFFRRRLNRIVPLYWLMTTAFLLTLLAGGTIHGAIGGPAYLAASYLFIPWPRPDGLMQPAFSLGWTLNFEMFFYAVFAPFLRLRRNLAVPGAILLLSGFVLFSLTAGFTNPQLSFWSNSVILEFCAGMLIALAPPGRLSLPVRLLLVLLALAGLHLATIAPPAWRALTYGAPAVALVAAAALGAPGPVNRAERWLVRLGDASYAMYLVHPFVMRAFSVLWHKIHERNELTGTIYVLAGLAAAQSCALAINMGERKVKALRRRGLTNEAV
jgi:peptidoglycan/LPS O-acetylase OafA/YrhL